MDQHISTDHPCTPTPHHAWQVENLIFIFVSLTFSDFSVAVIQTLPFWSPHLHGPTHLHRPPLHTNTPPRVASRESHFQFCFLDFLRLFSRGDSDAAILVTTSSWTNTSPQTTPAHQHPTTRGKSRISFSILFP